MFFETSNQNTTFVICATPLDKQKISVIIPLTRSTNRLRIDNANGKVYWNSYNSTSGYGSIWRANLNGTQGERIIEKIITDTFPMFTLSQQYLYILKPGAIHRTLLNGITCPSNCAGNGICDKHTGICTCDDNWQGLDCSEESGSELKLGELLLWIYGAVMGSLVIFCLAFWAFWQYRENKKDYEESTTLLE